ncbi:MAG: phosphosulfolactate synthase [bacterium]
MPGSPDFLALPSRDVKPRSRGLTHVLDKGLAPEQTSALAGHCAHLIDIVKVGWGIAYVDPCIAERVATYRAAGVDVSLGGTLVEICAMQGRIPQLRDWALSLGVTVMEVSNGLHQLDPSAKTGLVRQLSADFAVAAEVGDKDPEAPVVAARWIEEMESDLAAGATGGVAEGRESGTVGIYAGDGTVRSDLIDVVADRIPLDRVIFETPHKSQQAWFIDRTGPGVNLGNIAPDDVLPLETLRLGLRADTALTVATGETLGSPGA